MKAPAEKQLSTIMMYNYSTYPDGICKQEIKKRFILSGDKTT
jgi:hypothetical protein